MIESENQNIIITKRIKIKNSKESNGCAKNGNAEVEKRFEIK